MALAYTDTMPTAGAEHGISSEKTQSYIVKRWEDTFVKEMLLARLSFAPSDLSIVAGRAPVGGSVCGATL